MNGTIISLPSDNATYQISLLPEIKFISSYNMNVQVYQWDNHIYSNNYVGNPSDIRTIDLGALITPYRCDLLSKIVSLTLINNKYNINKDLRKVAICFQKLYL